MESIWLITLRGMYEYVQCNLLFSGYIMCNIMERLMMAQGQCIYGSLFNPSALQWLALRSSVQLFWWWTKMAIATWPRGDGGRASRWDRSGLALGRFQGNQHSTIMSQSSGEHSRFFMMFHDAWTILLVAKQLKSGLAATVDATSLIRQTTAKCYIPWLKPKRSNVHHQPTWHLLTKHLVVNGWLIDI